MGNFTGNVAAGNVVRNAVGNFARNSVGNAVGNSA